MGFANTTALFPVPSRYRTWRGVVLGVLVFLWMVPFFSSTGGFASASPAPQHDLAFCKEKFHCTLQATKGYPYIVYALTDNLEGWSCHCSWNEDNCKPRFGQKYGCYVATPNVPGCANGPATENDGQIDTCITCSSGYQMPTGAAQSLECWACGATVAGCAHCSANNVCDQCADGFQLFKGSNECGNCAAHCSSCSAPNTCDICESRFTLSPDKSTCFSCPIDNCNGCTADGVCGSCATGFTLSPDKSTCFSCPIDNCNGCTANGVCGSCATGFTLSPDKSTCFSCPIDNCNGCTADGVCGSCATGFTLSPDKSTCFSCPIDNCNGCTADGVCGGCAAEYKLSPSRDACFLCSVLGCESCSADNVCAECDGGYTVSSNSSLCFPCEIGGCASCADPTVCRACSDGYVLTPAKQCAACTAANCARCVSPGDGSTCAECAKGFKVDGGKGTCAKKGIPWWVWLIVGLGVATVIVMIIIIVRCCRRDAEESALLAGEDTEDTQLATSATDGGSEAASSDCVSKEDGDSTSLHRTLSQRARMVSIGGEVVLDASHPGLPQFPSFYSIRSGVSGTRPVDGDAADERQPLNLRQPRAEPNPLSPPHAVDNHSGMLDGFW